MVIDLTFLKRIQVSMSSDLVVYDIKNNYTKSQDTSKFEFKKNLLYFEGQLYVVEGEAQ